MDPFKKQRHGGGISQETIDQLEKDLNLF